MKFSVPQESGFSLLLLLVYNNDSSQTTKLCKVNQFPDNTNLLNFSKSVNKLM